MNGLWRQERSLLRCLVLLSFYLVLFGMAGCTSTPKNAASRFDSFQKVTASITQDIPKIDLLSLPQAQYHETDQLLKAIDDGKQRLNVLEDDYGIKNLNPFKTTYAENFQARVSYLQYLSMYSNSLKSIMSSSSISELNTNIKDFGKTMDAFKTNVMIKVEPSLTTTSFSEIANGAAAIITFGLEKARNEKVKYIITQTTPPLRDVLGRMAMHIGSCTSKNLPSGSVALAVTNYYNESLTQDQKKFDAINALDKEKTRERFNALQALIQKKQKLQLTCTLLDATNTMLANYAQLHADLEKAFDKDSGDLTTSITNVSLQIQTIETALNILGAKEK
ncbi:hypothetical protein GTA51_04895 [Desulfovibrio aerotolerans]|uniref:Uncharacterized protein n=1 Tax=Solidesulfovibrio aerotolerans TaxID=295255 RepID=A0A7C9MU94_9BACT|nr:hypothetical protein [Solidesulfovibrio aerotolerans]MYL82474.1 hypothetical protein [Solidesulfovibrio aerotolerans]